MHATLSSILFRERKEQAMSILAQLEAGYLTTKNGQRVELKYLSLEDFHRLFTTLTGLDTIKGFGGYFSTAMVDLGAGSLETVIKFGYPFNDMGVEFPKHRTWKNDYFWNYAAMVQELGGRSSCTPFPDIYYLNTLELANNTQLPVCVMEFVAVTRDRHTGRGLERVLEKAFAAIKTKTNISSDPVVQEALQTWHWSYEDLVKFSTVILELTDGVELFDLSEGTNSGWRSDGSLCVFDPLGMKDF
jgi:hypothetical protein